MGSFVAASIYLCFTLLYGRRMRAVKEGVEEEGKKEINTNNSTSKKEGNTNGKEREESESDDNEEEKGKEICVTTMSDKVNTGVPEVGGEGSRGT